MTLNQLRTTASSNGSKSSLKLTADGERLFVLSKKELRVHPPNLNAAKQGQPNRVSTTKFTLITWLPLSLFYQFHRVSNVYFLVVSVLCLLLGDKSPYSWSVVLMPLVLVLCWTALKDAWEDWYRHRDDQRENSRVCKVFNIAEQAFVDSEWRHVHAGNLLLVPCDGAFPADLIVMHAACAAEAFISTANLDGETNLKARLAPSLCSRLVTTAMDTSAADPEEAEKAARALCASEVSMRMAAPEANLAAIRGRLELNDDECAVCETSFLPRGCILRNTPWVLAMAAYVGDDSKARLNAVQSKKKVSNMQTHLSRCVLSLLGALVFFALVWATVGQAVGSDDDSWPIRFFRYFVTFYYVVPVSLYVIFEMFKLFLGHQVDIDSQMVDPDTGLGAVARTADLMEEMGQVDFIFSDKTGTLTANEMIFARCCISGKDLGDFRKTADNQDGHCAARRILTTPGESMHEPVNMFFTCLALCHSAQVKEGARGGRDSTSEAQELVYSAMSPDEVALVQAARDVGVVFRSRERLPGTSGSEITLEGPGLNQVQTFQVLHEIEFTSDRKRMSVVVRYGDEVWCVTKGADSTMAQLLDQPLDTATLDQLSAFSKKGLRTLVVAMKRVDPAYLREWETALKSAEAVVDVSRNDQVAKVSARIETGMKLVGVTAVEDRLQDGVPNAIQTVKDAGIRLWVLTGDKVETAVDIAFSCALFDGRTHLAFATHAENIEETLEKLTRAKRELAGKVNGGLVMDGGTLTFALANPAACNMIYELGIACRSCVCCRLSPKQKRQLVQLVRDKSKTTITLAIGDGANDVPMIEGAHLGVGVRGKEGVQAVQVSDIAISQFRFLVPLLLCHGQRAYRRIAVFLCFFLYKNVALVMSDVIWSIQDDFQGRVAFPEWLSMGYNAIFTSWHILFALGWDKGVPDHVANCHPELYADGPLRRQFNPFIFFLWMCYAVLHGCVAWLVPNYWYGSREYTEGPSDFWKAACASFLLTCVIVNIKLLLNCYNAFTLPALASTAASFILAVLTLLILGHTPLGDFLGGSEMMQGLPSEMASTWQAWLSLILVPLIALSMDVAEKVLRSLFCPSEMAKLRMAGQSARTAVVTLQE